MKVWSFLLAVFFALPLCLGVGVAFAQTPSPGTGLSLSPPTFEFSANPGDTLKNVIRVQNISEKDVKVVVEKRNFTALGEEGSISITEEETSFSLASWITLGWTEFDLPEKGTVTFPFEIKVPLNAEPGGHFGSIIFKVGGMMPEQTGAAVVQELGALVLLRVAGETTEVANLESFSPKKTFWEYGPVEFEARIKNTGNVHLKPTGTVIITNFFGKKVATLEVESRNVLPGATRKIPAIWEQKFLLGKYTTTVSLTYGAQGKVLTASTIFVGFPYKIGGIILAILVILSVIIYKARGRLRLALQILFGRHK